MNEEELQQRRAAAYFDGPSSYGRQFCCTNTYCFQSDGYLGIPIPAPCLVTPKGVISVPESYITAPQKHPWPDRQLISVIGGRGTDQWWRDWCGVKKFSGAGTYVIDENEVIVLRSDGKRESPKDFDAAKAHWTVTAYGYGAMFAGTCYLYAPKAQGHLCRPEDRLNSWEEAVKRIVLFDSIG